MTEGVALPRTSFSMGECTQIIGIRFGGALEQGVRGVV